MPKILLLLLLLTPVAFSQSDEGKKTPPAVKQEPVQAAPVATLPSQTITIPQPFLMKSEGGPEPSPWTTWGPFVSSIAGIVVALGSVFFTQWNSRKMLSDQHKNSITLLQTQKDREHEMWDKQRRWEKKWETYIELAKALAEVADAEVAAQVAENLRIRNSDDPEVQKRVSAAIERSHTAKSRLTQSYNSACIVISLESQVALQHMFAAVAESNQLSLPFNIASDGRLESYRKGVSVLIVEAQKDLGFTVIERHIGT